MSISLIDFVSAITWNQITTEDQSKEKNKQTVYQKCAGGYEREDKHRNACCQK